jgi:glycosyltransferase involved in cell wall biosynthesis
MKILHLIYDDPDNPWLGGGGAIRTRKINQLLADHHDITVVTGNFPGARNEKKDGITYVRIGSTVSYFLSRVTFALRAGRTVRSIGHDILVEDFSGNSPTFSTRHTRQPAVAVLQNYFGFNIVRKKLLNGILPWLYEKYFIGNFSRYIPVNQSIMDAFIPGAPADRYRVIPQGIDRKDITAETFPEEFFLFVGRLDFYQKGIDVLVNSLSMVADLKIPLVVVGGGDCRKLAAMARRAGVDHLLKHHPRVPHEHILSVYRRSYCLLLPSRYEGWPLVCLESYSQGRPVIGTDIPGLDHVVQNGITGLKVPVGDPAAFADALRNFAGDRALRMRLGANAVRFAARYTWDTLAGQQEQFYRETIDHASNRPHGGNL